MASTRKAPGSQSIQHVLKINSLPIPKYSAIGFYLSTVPAQDAQEKGKGQSPQDPPTGATFENVLEDKSNMSRCDSFK